MSNSLQLLNKILFFLYFLIFLIWTIQCGKSFGVGVSPPALHLEGREGELLCGNLTILGEDKLLLFKIYDSWGRECGGNLECYNQSASELGIESRYSYYAGVFGKNEFKVCFRSENEGYYLGMLFVESEEADAGIGVKLNLNVSSKEELGDVRLSGLAIESYKPNSEGKAGLPGIYCFFVLIAAIISIFLIRKLLTK